MNKKLIFISVFFISLLLVSTATAVPHAKAQNIDQIIEKKKAKDLLENQLIDFNDLIQLILRIMRFLQNLTAILIGFLTPLLPLLESIETFLLNILEKLEPWGVLVGAIVAVIEAIFALIDAITNIINPPTFSPSV